MREEAYSFLRVVCMLREEARNRPVGVAHSRLRASRSLRLVRHIPKVAEVALEAAAGRPWVNRLRAAAELRLRRLHLTYPPDFRDFRQHFRRDSPRLGQNLVVFDLP